MVSKEEFIKITDMVIKNLEGGYFHRSMLADGRAKDPKGLLSKGPGRVDSGETMFGLDRVNGIGYRKDAPKEWDEFWSIIDKAGWAKKVKYGYLGGDLGPRLRSLAASILYPAFVKYSKLYISPAAAAIVSKDPRIVFNFSYAVWNGPGFFKKYANLINDAVRQGFTSSDKLYRIIMDQRVKSSNELIRNTGVKIEKLLSTITPTAKKVIGGAIVVWIVIGCAALFFLIRNQNK